MTKTTSRFEVSLQDRLNQSQEARLAHTRAVRGYKKYRVYDILVKEEEPNMASAFKALKNRTYRQQHIGRALRGAGVKPGVINYYGLGRSTGKSAMLQYCYYDSLLYPEIYSVAHLLYKTQWLKPSQATMLRLKGHKVEIDEA